MTMLTLTVPLKSVVVRNDDGTNTIRLFASGRLLAEMHWDGAVLNHVEPTGAFPSGRLEAQQPALEHKDDRHNSG